MSRILMISTSRETSPQPAVPIGAAWVAQALHVAGFEVRLLDLCFERNALEAIRRTLEAFAPHGIGISVRNLDNCDFLSPKSFLPELKEITRFIKSHTDAPVLLGGAGVSVMPLQVLEYLDLEYSVAGEGERAAVAFFNARNEDEAVAVPGVVSRAKGRAVAPSSCPPSGIWVMPRAQAWIRTANYLRLEPVLPVQGKRGCAKNCLYCTYQRIEGSSWRLREAGAVAEEIAAAMSETGAREFEFVDSLFNEPEGYLEALLEEILRRELKVWLRASSLSPKGLTLEQLRLMERAGFTSFVITPETACDVTLAALRKDFSEEEVHRAAALLTRSTIRALWCFVVGGPQEDEASLRKTIGFINSSMAHKDCAFLTTGLRIFPHTALHDMALREAVVDERDDLLMPKFYFSQNITPQKARHLLTGEISDIARCIFLSDTQLGSLDLFRRMGTMLRLPGPFWSYAGYMNRISSKRRVISRNWSS